MIVYQDFLPNPVPGGGLATEYEPLPSVVVRVNEWIAATKVDVVNIETVLLPNIVTLTTAGDTAKSTLHTSSDMGSRWYQIVRVWFRAARPPE